MRALISVSDKTGIIDFTSSLIELGYEVISTGGTYDVLTRSGIPATPVDSVTQFPEILDGRVKTLHPAIHGGLLAVRQNNHHMAACRAHNITLIDLVIVNLYPFESIIQNEKSTRDDAIENIDIGGPSMLRSAAKNHQSVGVVVDPAKYSEIAAELRDHNGTLTETTRRRLAIEAFRHTSQYDAVIAEYLDNCEPETSPLFPSIITSVLHKKAELRYGENPHQKAALYQAPGSGGLSTVRQLNGKPLSFNNLVDLESAWHLAREFHAPAAVIIKHTNPCGVAVSDTLVDAYRHALASDPVSAFGSIIGVNQPLDKDTAEEMSTLFIEAIIAPDFEPDALSILAQKPSLRLIQHPQFFNRSNLTQMTYIDGGVLIQEHDHHPIQAEDLRFVTTTQSTHTYIDDLLFAFTVAAHVKSNAIVIAKNNRTVGIGAGQMNRVGAVNIALQQAGTAAHNAVAASDAFFPFKDSIEKLADASIASIIQPGGSKRDQESIDACNQRGIAMAFTDIRHFKH